MLQSRTYQRLETREGVHAHSQLLGQQVRGLITEVGLYKSVVLQARSLAAIKEVRRLGSHPGL
jgi:hypothetical protein